MKKDAMKKFESSKLDKAVDKATGFKEGSKKDMKVDKAILKYKKK